VSRSLIVLSADSVKAIQTAATLINRPNSWSRASRRRTVRLRILFDCANMLLPPVLSCRQGTTISRAPPSAKCDPGHELNESTKSIGMYFLRTGSTAQLQWLRVFEPLMVITGIVQPLATIPSISKLYFTHSQHASGQSLTTWSIFAVASLLWVTYGLLNRKPAIYVGNIIGLVVNLLMVNGILMNAGWTY
jgi:MtN3 and saliva related transmembrane protein